MSGVIDPRDPRIAALDARFQAPPQQRSTSSNSNAKNTTIGGNPAAFAEANELSSVGHMSSRDGYHQTTLLSHLSPTHSHSDKSNSTVGFDTAVKHESVSLASSRDGLRRPLAQQQQQVQQQQQQQHGVDSQKKERSAESPPPHGQPGVSRPSSTTLAGAKRSHYFTEEEDRVVRQFGADGITPQQWEQIAADYRIDRSGKALQNRFKRLRSNGQEGSPVLSQTDDAIKRGTPPPAVSGATVVPHLAGTPATTTHGTAATEGYSESSRSRGDAAHVAIVIEEESWSGVSAPQQPATGSVPRPAQRQATLQQSVGRMESSSSNYTMPPLLSKGMDFGSLRSPSDFKAAVVRLSKDRETLVEHLHFLSTQHSRVQTERGKIADEREALAQERAELEALRARIPFEAAAVQHGHQNMAIRHQASLALRDAMQRLAEAEHETARLVLARNSERLGRIGHERHGLGPQSISEVWVEGYQFVELRRKREQTAQEIASIAESKSNIKKRKQQVKKYTGPQLMQLYPDPSRPSGARDLLDADTIAERQQRLEEALDQEKDMLEGRLKSLKLDQRQQELDLEMLSREKQVHIRELKRCKDEDNSAYCTTPRTVLKDGRYVLLNLLGKGGFSEVYRAFDTLECVFVAVKLHQLNDSWSARKKENYIKHAEREHKIQRSMQHPNIVRLLDSFTINKGVCFATVLEYCDGPDLDMHLKRVGKVVEKEARTIMCQVFAALHYFFLQPTRIIHYDLKPGNIIFARGGPGTSRLNMLDAAAAENEFIPASFANFGYDQLLSAIACVKITDFGLSKEADEDRSSVDLTSQGAGTYWYLPPECFPDVDAAQQQFRTGSSAGGTGAGSDSSRQLQPPPVRITNKVDVWSAGVILYQMVFGCKPFGHNLSQQRILADGIIQRSTLAFPEQRDVSDTCRDFIATCLTPDLARRPDVQQCLQHPFLSGKASGQHIPAQQRHAHQKPQQQHQQQHPHQHQHQHQHQHLGQQLHDQHQQQQNFQLPFQPPHAPNRKK